MTNRIALNFNTLSEIKIHSWNKSKFYTAKVPLSSIRIAITDFLTDQKNAFIYKHSHIQLTKCIGWNNEWIKSNALCMSCCYKLNCEEIKKIFYCTTPFCRGWTQREIFRRRHKHTSKELQNYNIHQLIRVRCMDATKKKSNQSLIFAWLTKSVMQSRRIDPFLHLWGIQ